METVGDGKEKKIVVSHINIRQSIFFLLLKLLLLDLFATVIVVVFFSALFIPQLSNEAKITIISYNASYFFILATVKGLVTLWVVLQWLNEYYEITTHAIYHRRGVFWQKEERYQLEHVKSIGVQQSIIGRVFNYGSLKFYDWRLEKSISIFLIHNPHRYMRILGNLLPETNQEKETVREQIIRDPEEDDL